MKAFLKALSALVLVLLLMSPLLFWKFCSVVDSIFAEPTYQTFINEGDLSYVDKGFCGSDNLDELSRSACTLLTVGEINKTEIVKEFENTSIYKDLLVIEKFGVQTSDGFTGRILSLVMPSVYDVYRGLFTSEYQVKVEYSYLNIFENFNRLRTRLTTAICFPKFDREELIFDTGSHIVMLSENDNFYIVKNVHGETEEILFFTKEPQN